MSSVQAAATERPTAPTTHSNKISFDSSAIEPLRGASSLGFGPLIIWEQHIDKFILAIYQMRL